MSLENFKAWCVKNPNLLYIASLFGAVVMAIMLGALLGLLIPIDVNLDTVIEPISTMIYYISIGMVILPASVAVLKIKHRSIWWLLLFWLHSPLWLSDSKQQCKTKYIYAVLAFDTIFLTYGLTYTIEYVQKNPLEGILNGILIYAISLTLASIANSNLGKDDNLVLENTTVHDVKDPEVKE